MNLNPQGLPEIDEALNKSKAEQLWYFLNDSFPREDRDELLTLIDNKLKSVVCLNTDICYFADSKRELKENGLEYMAPYIPMLSECYVPYFYEVTPNPGNSEQNKLLDKIYEYGSCWASVKEEENSVPATISLIYNGLNRHSQVFLKLKT